MGLSSETTLVPDLQLLDLAAAKAAISNRFLNFGLATYDESVKNEEDSLNAWVFRQNPDYDGFSRVNKGMEVFVWLTVDSTLLPVTDTIQVDLNNDADAENDIIF